MGRSVRLAVLSALVLTAAAASAQGVDSGIVVRIREVGFRRSRVMELASTMTDVFGPRYANSPSYDAAAAWAKQTFQEFGLVNAALEPWGEYGFAWENTYTSVHLLKPRYQPIIAYAIPGTRGTDGEIRSAVVAIDTGQLESEADLDPWRGKLRGKIVFTEPKRTLVANFDPQAVRLSDEELRGMARLDIQALGSRQPRAGRREGTRPRRLSRAQVAEFFEGEGVAVTVRPGGPNVGPMDKGVVTVTGSGPLPLDEEPPLPGIVMAAEHYNRIIRILEQGVPAELEVEVRNTLSDADPLDYNVIAELTGGDLADEVVMIGAHYDAEPAGTGATDNASGSAMVMEAMRILATVEAQPRRTIRAALWGAEESGLLGSRGYVTAHFGDPKTGTRLPEHDKLSVYFNVDWYGRFRGIYLQGNDAARPIFEAWMRPFHDVGMSWIVPGNTGGSDHMAFLEVGLPGFQFVQDDLEFFNVTFHTNMDVYDRLIPEDLKQGAVILASFAYHAAMRDGKFPRADGIDNGRRWHK